MIGHSSMASGQVRAVVIINDFCYIKGGASRVAFDEALAMAEQGLTVHYFGAVGPIDPELVNVPNLTVTCLNQPEILNVGKNPLIMVQGLWNFRAARRMDALLATMDPKQTVVHLHGYSKALTASIIPVILRRGFALVHTLHDYFVACPNGGFFNYQKVQDCPVRCLSARCMMTNCDKRSYTHKLYRLLKSSIQKCLGRWPSGVRHFIYLSETALARVRPYLPAQARLHYLENINETERKEPAHVAENKAIVFVGELDHHKGIKMLLEAAKRSGVKIVCVGKGVCEDEIKAHGQHVTGWLRRDEVQAEIEKARAVVFPSLLAETYGLVVTEAVARGVPAIVSDITAAAERIEHGKTGWIFKTGDVEDLSRCLEETKDDLKVATLGQAAYDRFWQSPPTRAAHTTQLLAIYEDVLAEQRKKII